MRKFSWPGLNKDFLSHKKHEVKKKKMGKLNFIKTKDCWENEKSSQKVKIFAKPVCDKKLSGPYKELLHLSCERTQLRMGQRLNRNVTYKAI